MSRKPNDIKGQRFGRLLVIGDSGLRSTKGSVRWLCICDCGAKHMVLGANLQSGSVSSCGCLARELSAARRIAAKQPPKKCIVEGCANDTSKGGYGMCGLHAQRVRRYGNHEHITPENVRRANNRASQLARVADVKPTTYRKSFGRHEHRAVAEKMIGRALLPTEHVHHIDHNKHNNSPDNLQVMTASEHLKLHAMERKHG